MAERFRHEEVITLITLIYQHASMSDGVSGMPHEKAKKIQARIDEGDSVRYRARDILRFLMNPDSELSLRKGFIEADGYSIQDIDFEIDVYATDSVPHIKFSLDDKHFFNAKEVENICGVADEFRKLTDEDLDVNSVARRWIRIRESAREAYALMRDNDEQYGIKYPPDP